MRVLVTGAGGFAGGHVVEHLTKTTDWDVVSSGVDLNVEAPAWDGVDAVLHLAARSDVTECNDRPVDAVHNNIDATLNLLEWAREQPITHVVQISTNEIYGPSPGGEEPKEWAPIAPSTPYSASKVAQEALSCAWWRTYGVPVVLTNTMHLFGEGQPKQRFIPMAVRKLMAGEEVPIYARRITDNHYVPSTRRWLYAGDHADALRWILMQPVSTPENYRPDRWHIAGPEVNLVSLVKKIAEILDVPARVQMVDDSLARPGHEYRYALDCSKIERAGWTPPLGFNDALIRTVNWISEQ